MPALHPIKVETFLQAGSARVKEIVIAPQGHPKGVEEKHPPKRAPQIVHKNQLPLFSYRRRISDFMWTIIRCSTGQYMTITCVQLTASYM